MSKIEATKVAVEIINPKSKLYAIEARDTSLALTESSLSLLEAQERSDQLQSSPETLKGEKAVLATLTKFNFPSAILPYRLLFPPAAFDAYLGMYSQFEDCGRQSLIPAEDVFVVQGTDNKPQAYLSRSSLWSAVIDGVATARQYEQEMELGSILNIGGVQPCFRREVKAVQPGWREIGFTQADIELVALTSKKIPPQLLDTLSVRQFVYALKSIGLPENMIQIRINNFMEILYSILGDQINFLDKEIFGFDMLDRMATARVLGENIVFEELRNKAIIQLGIWMQEGQISEHAFQLITKLIEIGQFDENIIKEWYPNEYRSFLDLKQLLIDVKNEYPEINIFIDPLSIRGGTPGYDRTTMQADIVTDQRVFPEIGGGGAYKKASQLSWQVLFDDQPPENFYMVGFALGLIRINSALELIEKSYET